MCRDCWTRFGSPSTVTPSIRSAAAQVASLDEITGCGGNLHVVLDDWNLDDENLAACGEAIDRVRAGKPRSYDDTHPPQVAIEAAILEAMMPMTEAERATVLALRDGFVS